MNSLCEAEGVHQTEGMARSTQVGMCAWLEISAPDFRVGRKEGEGEKYFCLA